MADTLKSPAMTPKEFAPVWKCRHCRHKWLIVNEDAPPKQCPNRKCRAMDWDRPKKKEGRPSKLRPKGKSKTSGKRGKRK